MFFGYDVEEGGNADDEVTSAYVHVAGQEHGGDGLARPQLPGDFSCFDQEQPPTLNPPEAGLGEVATWQWRKVSWCGRCG